MPQMIEKIILAGGCFWGMQDLFRRETGIVGTRVGYSGGEAKNATYDMVKHGTSGHAEAIEIEYDANLISFRDILALFFQLHDPTTSNRQGGDVGSQYRSAIFYTTEAQKKMALKTIIDVEKTGLWPNKIITEVTFAGDFWQAENEHQDYLERYPSGYTCHFLRPHWKLPT
ncbi:MAG: peptide-methionine (S)-S-oxide reductase [Robiginitomaculum sp.]|nr:MAG: peptide-methionine (S)-S-oxide reductase [Robiginitomaculum sp.]